MNTNKYKSKNLFKNNFGIKWFLKVVFVSCFDVDRRRNTLQLIVMLQSQ